MMFTTCDYDSDKTYTQLKQKFSMGMPPNELLRTLTDMGFRVNHGKRQRTHHEQRCASPSPWGSHTPAGQYEMDVR